MSNNDKILLDIDDDIATIRLNRPEVKNAFDAELIYEFNQILDNLTDNNNIRALILTGNGGTFCAGADLNWMGAMVDYSEEQNYKDSKNLADLLYKLYSFKAPTICISSGAAFGGAVGLISCCDIAMSLPCKFALSEVKLGLAPAVISPYVVNAIGARNARRYMLTGSVFTETKALEIGLIHKIVNPNNFESYLDKILSNIKACGKIALQTTKQLIEKVEHSEISPKLIDHTAKTIAKLRVSEEGQTGIKAFLDKTTPQW